jgi:preprotein translocase subunit SecY
MKLVDNAKDWSKWWSVRLSIVGGALLTFLEIYPNAVGTVIQVIPVEIRASINTEILRIIGIVCVIASPVARVIKQAKLDHKPDETTKT